MLKLAQSVHILNGLKSTRILACRAFSDEAPRTEKTINSIQLLGRVGVEPQQRGSEAHPVVTFSLATHNNYKTESGDWLQRVDWHKIAVFKPQLRELTVNYLSKGQRVMVNGKVSYGEIKDREGAARATTTIIAEEIIFFQ